jgi:hypothetical protein
MPLRRSCQVFCNLLGERGDDVFRRSLARILRSLLNVRLKERRKTKFKRSAATIWRYAATAGDISTS